jgi:hypothetical protein
MQPVAPTPGASGYFSSPEKTLDPALFGEGESIKPEIRHWITRTLYTFWRGKYNRAEAWSTVWIAGSGISYQWSASRGNGDLDVLIGIDYAQFFEDNPRFRGMSYSDLSEIFNQEMHQYLWPKTAETNLGGRVFEVTFYVNPNSTDIRDIHPYAAYNLTTNEWTVRPPSGSDFEHPKEFFDSAQHEVDQAWALVNQYNTLANQAKSMNPGSPGWHNAMRQAELLVSQAGAMYDQIHLGRKQAFGQGGSGYGDYYNFRWQYHKQNGTAEALHGVAAAHSEAQKDYQTALYGTVLDGADVALRRAALWQNGRH